MSSNTVLLLGNIIYFSLFEQHILYTYITHEEKLVVPESSDHENIVETKHYLPSFSWNISALGGDFSTTSAINGAEIIFETKPHCFD